MYILSLQLINSFINISRCTSIRLPVFIFRSTDDDDLIEEKLEETLAKCGKRSTKKILGTKRRKSGANKALKFVKLLYVD